MYPCQCPGSDKRLQLDVSLGEVGWKYGESCATFAIYFEFLFQVKKFQT